MDGKKRVLIVDDSRFSISIITEMLERNGYEVVGEAMNKEEVEQKASELKPDVVTMDMTLPGTDGFECTEIVKKVSPESSVVIVSSLMDEELLEKAKKLKVSGYIQKPVEESQLLAELERASNYKDIFNTLEGIYFDVFKESFADNMNKMTRTLVNFKDEQKKNNVERSKGISIVIGIIGAFSGKMVVDLSNETAGNMASEILKKEEVDMDTILNLLSEWANIIAGNACSMLNMKDRSYGLKIAPPTIFYGEAINISQVNLEVMSVDIETSFGEVTMSVGFKRGEK
ncbi:chemotaxis protein CheY [Andreesenia angusta]|uniref:Chemotaxis protein CheY n=1 Tax=Andreesenia angusta TaxID=39480 RepID=A0A1S1V9Z4_9FIRM|nr:response regulator [Andreesenia angusta]OHW63230.1 chemotaxis protein CheY [Andreesenia angusta]